MTNTVETTDKLMLAKLTEAQKQFLLSLPENGEWRGTDDLINRWGRNALRGFGQSGLIEGYYREETRHRLTAQGMRITKELRS